uniref:Uncharacterized protein n=1 Tax=Lepeophtheirus salmonis TaxID=72036 RepID=A0A0K2T9S0_LEPSM
MYKVDFGRKSLQDFQQRSSGWEMITLFSSLGNSFRNYFFFWNSPVPNNYLNLYQNKICFVYQNIEKREALYLCESKIIFHLFSNDKIDSVVI